MDAVTERRVEALIEEIRTVIAGLDGSDVARAGACVALGKIWPAQGKGCSWVLETLEYCAEARYAAVKLGEELEEKITTKAKK